MSNPRQAVFVVSADRLVRAAVEQVLAAECMHTMMFESGAEFLSFERPDVPACLVLDVVTSDMNGLDLQPRLAERNIPVLFVTQQAQIATSVSAIKAGALDFLTLPLRATLLLKAIRSAIEIDVRTRERWQQTRRMRERLESLSSREIDVFLMTLDGMACKQMAAALGISTCTAQTHRRRVMRKMQVSSIADLMRRAELLQPSVQVLRLARLEYEPASSEQTRVERVGTGTDQRQAQQLRDGRYFNQRRVEFS